MIIIASGWKHGINLQNLYLQKTAISPIRKNIPTLKFPNIRYMASLRMLRLIGLIFEVLKVAYLE